MKNLSAKRGKITKELPYLQVSVDNMRRYSHFRIRYDELQTLNKLDNSMIMKLFAVKVHNPIVLAICFEYLNAENYF
jgi:hypothetical protein